MQKLKEEKILGTVPKNYKRVENFWDCLEFSRKQQNQKGITLIALIITIIVMLILVGVTINVALNGGLFEKAETASAETKKEVEKEQLLDAVLGTLDNNGNFNLNNIKLPEGFSLVSSDDTKSIYKGPSGQQYEVSKETGKIEETEIDNETSIKLGKYYMLGNSNYFLELLSETEVELGYVGTEMEFPGTYTFDKELGKITFDSTFAAGLDVPQEHKYLTKNNNNIIYYLQETYDENTSQINGKEGKFYTTNGYEGIKPRVIGTYEGTNNNGEKVSISFLEDGTADLGEFIDTEYLIEGIKCLEIDGEIICCAYDESPICMVVARTTENPNKLIGVSGELRRNRIY